MDTDNILWLDFETRSRVNLKTAGAYRYVACPDHRILVAGWALGNGKPEAHIIGPDGRLPLKLLNMLRDKRLQIRAHNAAFDRLQLKELGPPPERWYCTSAQARALALPGSLGDLGRALGARIQKGAEGADLIKELTIPQADGTFNDDPRLMAVFARYCARDVAAMRDNSLSLPQLRDEDLAVYHASERINDRGLPIDVELCQMAVKYAAVEKAEAEERVIALTHGALTKVRGTKLTEWVYSKLDPILRKHMDTYRTKKVDVVAGLAAGASESRVANVRLSKNDSTSITVKGKSLNADVRARLLEIAEDNPDVIPPLVVDVIEAAEAGSLMSTAKFQTMLNRVSADGRLRGAFVFNGAYQTNRWSSTGAQVHNFPRLVAEDPEAILKLMRADRPLPNVLRTLKSMLRPAIAPRGGKVIVRGDWNAIEARGLPWLVDSPAATAYMEAFKDPKRDIYIEQAIAAGLGPQRQPGKVVVLSIGYGGAVGALAAMARNYDVTIPQPDNVVRRWRSANGWVANKQTGWWAALGRCSMAAMRNPGQSFRAGRVVLRKGGDNLTMTLPSGRVLHYPMAEVVDGDYGPEIQYLKASWKPKKGVKKWPTSRLWHGVIAENADQGMCADLLREAVVRAERDGLEPIGHVHDELITEQPVKSSKGVGKELQRCMLASSPWAKGLPLKVEVDVSPRFRK